MTDYLQPLEFGVFATPDAARPAELIALAETADQAGLDLFTLQDHPYQKAHLDAWTTLAVIAARTNRLRVAPNVASLPLHSPVMLAKAAASLDLLSGGRVELGLGAGAFWDAIVAAGGPRRKPGAAVAATAEAIAVIREFWAGGTLRFEGEHYRFKGLHTGPRPAHEIPIWVGALGPRMLRLTGRLADGWVPSSGYAGPDALPALNAVIDEGAQAAGRPPAAVKRLYNISGSFGTGADFLTGRPRDWAEQLAELTLRDGMSSYILATDSGSVLQRFAAEVAPLVRELVDAGRATST